MPRSAENASGGLRRPLKSLKDRENITHLLDIATRSPIYITSLLFKMYPSSSDLRTSLRWFLGLKVESI